MIYFPCKILMIKIPFIISLKLHRGWLPFFRATVGPATSQLNVFRFHRIKLSALHSNFNLSRDAFSLTNDSFGRSNKISPDRRGDAIEVKLRRKWSTRDAANPDYAQHDEFLLTLLLVETNTIPSLWSLVRQRALMPITWIVYSRALILETINFQIPCRTILVILNEISFYLTIQFPSDLPMQPLQSTETFACSWHWDLILIGFIIDSRFVENHCCTRERGRGRELSFRRTLLIEKIVNARNKLLAYARIDRHRRRIVELLHVFTISCFSSRACACYPNKIFEKEYLLQYYMYISFCVWKQANEIISSFDRRK